jgi:CPA1 family monovalent cation:H+ antiporter
MVISITGQALALSGLAIFGLLLNRFVKIELTLACILCGFLAGLSLGFIDFDTGIRFHNLQDIVFFVILPVLIFEAAWHIKPGLLRRWLAPAMLLATVGVLVSCFVTAALVYIGIDHPNGFPWMAALICGAILSASDPISVIAQLKKQGAPEDLTTLFEGESLFNDATAVVLFTVFLGLAMNTGSEEAGFFEFFVMVFFGGILVGAASGVVSVCIARLLADSSATVLVLVFSAFGSFYIAEFLLEVSGIMAVMVSALICRWNLSGERESLTRGVSITWDWLALYLNSVLFIIMGLTITLEMFRDRWLAMLIAIGAALAARAAAVAVCGLLTWPLKHRIGLGWQIVLFWGGVRGAIAIALVLALPLELDYWYTVQSMVFGVVLFSMLVQGTTNQALVRRFGTPPEAAKS